MRRILSAALGLLFATGATTALAQQGRPTTPPPAGNGELRGIVTAAEGNLPLQHAGVAVRSAADSVLVAGAITGENGSFQIRGLRPGAYFMRVTLIGFAPQRKEFTITPAAPSVDAGTIAMARVAVALQGVEVTADRPTLTIEPDRRFRSMERARSACAATRTSRFRSTAAPRRFADRSSPRTSRDCPRTSSSASR